MPITLLTDAQEASLNRMCPVYAKAECGTVINALIESANSGDAYAGPVISEDLADEIDGCCPAWDISNGNIEIGTLLRGLTLGTITTDLTVDEIAALNAGKGCPVFAQIGDIGTILQAIINA